jgi:EpsI family protein
MDTAILSASSDPSEPAPLPPDLRAESRAGASAARARRVAQLLAGANLALAAYAYRALLVYRPTNSLSVSAESWFFEPTDTSPLVVLALAAWLAWRRRKRLARLDAQSGPWALSALLFALGIGVFAWSKLAGAPELQGPSLLINLLAAANLLGGLPALRILWLPIGFLIFAVPLPPPLLNHVVWKFQIWTANYTGFLLQLLGQAALVSGDRIIQSDNVFAIIETCSGLRSIETLTMLAVLMVDLFHRRRWHAALLVAAAPPVAFVVNGFRALGLMFNPHADVATIHNAQGIAMLLCGVLLLYGLDGLLERWLPKPPPRTRKVVRREPGARARALAPRLAVALGVFAGVAGLSLGLSRWQLDPFPVRSAPEAIPRTLGPWHSTDLETDYLFFGKTIFVRPVHRIYTAGADQVELFAAQGSLALRGRSVFSPKAGLPGSGWIVEESRVRRVGEREVEEKVVRRGSQRRLVQHWYEGSSGLWREALRSLLALDGSPLRRKEMATVVRISTPLGARRDLAEQRLRRFAARLEEPVKEMTTPRGEASG